MSLARNIALLTIVASLGASLAFVYHKTYKKPKKSTLPVLPATPKEVAEAAIKANKIMVFSKTTCPYCIRAKKAIARLEPNFGLVELDQIADGSEMQAALQEISGQRTVPNIFVNGRHIGGCDNTLASIASGDFQKMLIEL